MAPGAAFDLKDLLGQRSVVIAFSCMASLNRFSTAKTHQPGGEGQRRIGAIVSKSVEREPAASRGFTWRKCVGKAGAMSIVVYSLVGFWSATGFEYR